MSTLSCGIIGLPNVGKSTLFNALTNKSVPVENYPFTTIEPNVGIVPLNDLRLEQIAKCEKSAIVVPATVKFVDIAGLVKGASKGEGLGNKFLSHIRQVDATVHLIRTFEDKDVSHVDKSIDPKRDKETVEAELIIKDTETLEKKLKEIKRQAISDKRLAKSASYTEQLLEHLNKGNLAHSFPKSKEEEINTLRQELCLLTDKPILYLVNAAQENINPEVEKKLHHDLGLKDNEVVILIDAKLEEEISKLDTDEQKDFLKDVGLEKSAIDKLVAASFMTLRLITFFTANKNEARQSTIQKGSNIIQAAATIHTDFAEKFIAADVATYEDFIKYAGWQGCKEAGKARLEGRDYILKDGDVLFIRLGA